MTLKSQATIIGFVLFCFITCANADIKTIQPYKGKIQQSFTELARTRLARVYDINMPLSGELARIILEPGDKVKNMQIVVQLIQLPWRQAVNEAEARLDNYEAQHEYLAKELARREKLGKKNYITQSALDKTRSQKKVFAAQIAEAKAQLAIAKYRLQLSKIHSPIKGVILKRHTQGGRWTLTGKPLLQIGNLSEMDVISDVLSQDAQRLHVEDQVLLTSIGSSVTLKGKVERIEPAGFTKKSSLGVDEQRVNVIISIDNPKLANLGVGYRLEATFLVGKADEKALIIPRFSLLQDFDSQYYVLKVVKNKLRKQYIETGVKTDDKVSIEAGLDIQDRIVAQPTADMHDGMKI